LEPSHLHELKHHGFTHYDDIETALKKLFQTKIRKLESEQVPLRKAAGRVLSKDIFAKASLPAHDKSLVDGYALRAIDTEASTRKHPAKLKVQGEIKLGEFPQSQLSRMSCARVLTGGFVHEEADSVVMFEEVEASKSWVKIPRAVKKGENLVRAGIDVEKGTSLFKKGHSIRWFELGLFAALNQGKVSVVRRPKVAVLSTGDELSEPGEMGTPDSNRYVLLAASEYCGAEAVDLGIVSDNLDEILSALRRGLRSADIILVSGGSSVGKKDLVPEAVSKLGKPGLIVHGVAMRPGSPTGLGVVKGRPILILPGLPISALIGFYVLGQRILMRLTGSSEEYLALGVVGGTLMEDIEVQKGMTSFRPVRVEVKENEMRVYPVKPYGSSINSSIARADGIIHLNGVKGRMRSGARVSVYLLRSIGV
jgi:molybdopterin molybdotransferase